MKTQQILVDFLMNKSNIIEKGSQKSSKAIILLHGRGSNAQEIMSLSSEFDDNQTYFVAPQAPNNVWYPQSFMAPDQTNEPWLSSSVNTIRKLIEEIAKQIPKNKIYIFGFSQGACMALETASRYAEKYGGIVAFSGGLIGQNINESKYKGDFQGTKIFIGNSNQDPFIPLNRCKESKIVLEKFGADVTLKVYPGMPHIISDDEINWVKQNLLTRI